MQTKYVVTPEIDAMIEIVYRQKAGMGSCMHNDSPVRDLAKRINLPRWKVTRRARELGLIPKMRKEPDWCERELRILEAHAHKVPAVIQKHLRQNGFNRSVTGIILKRTRMRFLRNLDGYNGRNVALCFGVDEKTVRLWIEKGYLKAKRRGTERVKAQGGDMYWIMEKDIIRFIRNYLDVIDLRKVDKYWFVDLLLSEDK